MDTKKVLKTKLSEQISSVTGLEPASVDALIEKPKKKELGDLAFPCFLLAKIWKISPPECAKRLMEELNLPEGFSEITAVGPFLNFRFSREQLTKTILDGLQGIAGNNNLLASSKQTVLVEYSSPNIAKPFHVGHLRATLIGNCLDRVYRFLGYPTVSVNHLGDWGTQFGFVWAGCKLWGKPEDPSVNKLVDLYRRATALKESQEEGKETEHPDVNSMARNFFLDLEKGETYAREFWKWCLDISMEYLDYTYQRLNVSFDHYLGESFYSDKLEQINIDLENAGLIQESQGALGVDLGQELGFARISTPDGRSLYLTRDLAAAEYRFATFKFEKSIYVVGSPQTLHFKQLKAILAKLNKNYTEGIIHVAFGHVLGMKTRASRKNDGKQGADFIELNEFLDEAFDRSLKAYNEQVSKRPEGLDEQQVAKCVALSAIVFSTLSRSRLKDVHFKWEHALEFQGDTGPYLLYACARVNSIKERALAEGLQINPQIKPSLLIDDSAYQLINLLGDFENTLKQTIEDNEPAHLTSYALALAKAFSKAYLELKVIGEKKDLAEARLYLFETVLQILGKTLELLGMKTLKKM